MDPALLEEQMIALKISRGSSSSVSRPVSLRLRQVISETGKSSFMFECPVDPDSIEGLKFIGFTLEAAKDLHARWKNRPNPEANPNNILLYIKGHTSLMCEQDFESLNLSRSEALEKIGLSQETIKAILDPRYDAIFQTQELEYWVMNTLITNYNTLQNILRRVQKAGIRAVKKKNKRLKAVAASPPPLSLLNTESPSASGSNRLPLSAPTVTSNVYGKYRPSFFTGCNVISDMPETLPNHTTIYKAIAIGDLYGSRSFPLIDSNGNIDFRSFQTGPNGDFNRYRSALYWTSELATAELYRQYAEERSPYSETMIITMQVPNQFLASLRTHQFPYGNPWKSFVWHCRYNYKAPEGFEDLVKNTDLIKGPILSGATKWVVVIKEEDLETQITDNEVMKISGQRSVQWCFLGYQVWSQLAEAVKGKVHIEHYPALRSSMGE